MKTAAKAAKAVKDAAKKAAKAVKGAAAMIADTMRPTGEAAEALKSYATSGPAAFFQSLADNFATVRDGVTFTAAVGAFAFITERKAKGEEPKEYRKALEGYLAPFAAWRMARYYGDLGFCICRYNLSPAEVKGNVAAIVFNASTLKEAANREAFLADVAKLAKARRDDSPRKRGAKGDGAPKVMTAEKLMNAVILFAETYKDRLAIPGGVKAIKSALDFTGADASPFEAVQNMLLLAVGADADQQDAAKAKAAAKAS